MVGGSLSQQRRGSRWNRCWSSLSGAEWDFTGAMELLKLNRSVQGPGPGLGSSLCRPSVSLLNSSSAAGNLSCEPPRIRGTGTRGGCLPKPFSLHPTALFENPFDLYTASCPYLSQVGLPPLLHRPLPSTHCAPKLS